MMVDGLKVTVQGGEMCEEEIKAYISHAREKARGRMLEALNIKLDGEYVDLTWTYSPKKFERIRRITGYLVGTMERWNNAKTAEERDRVKHI